MTYQIDDESKKEAGSKDAALPTGPAPEALTSKVPPTEGETIALVPDPETDSRNWPVEKKSEEGNYEVGEPVELPVSLRIKEVAAKLAADAAAAAETEAILEARRAATPGYVAPAAPASSVTTTPHGTPSAVHITAPADPANPMPRPIRVSKPVPISDEKSERLEAFLIKLRKPTIYSPLVGTFVGLGTATLVTIGWFYWPLWLAATVGLTAEMVITGAVYENGVAKFTDAFWRARTGEDMYECLQSPSIGGYGAAGLIFAILLRAAAMGAIVTPLSAEVRSGWEIMAAIVGSATIGRWIMLAIMATLPAMEDALTGAKDLPHRISLSGLGKAALLSIPGIVGYVWFFRAEAIFMALLILIVAVPMFINFIRRTLGAYTPECLGFGCYIGQVVLLLAAAMYHRYLPNP